jgi:hypothetical protein
MNKFRVVSVVSILCLSLMAVTLTQTVFANRSYTSTAFPIVQQESTAPKILSTRIKGTKLLLFGENFDASSMVTINGRLYTPKFDPQEPTLLTVKKGFKKVAAGSVATVQVQNGAGQTSAPTGVFAGVTINFTDAGKTITIGVGEKVQLLLKQAPYIIWVPVVGDETVLSKIQDADQAPGAQGVFQGLKRGTTKLQAGGSACPPNSPVPCGIPAILFEVTIVVE